VWVELSSSDAERLGVSAGDRVCVESVRGRVEGPARISDIRPGSVFVPFHYGYWDEGQAAPDDSPPRAANELTITAWDPVSKQPLFKVAAVRVRPVPATEGA
jgi:anaerobic selenocysteine-containing dehydrogenase